MPVHRPRSSIFFHYLFIWNKKRNSSERFRQVLKYSPNKHVINLKNSQLKVKCASRKSAKMDKSTFLTSTCQKYCFFTAQRFIDYWELGGEHVINLKIIKCISIIYTIGKFLWITNNFILQQKKIFLVTSKVGV